jgi:hypothetical protein
MTSRELKKSIVASARLARKNHKETMPDGEKLIEINWGIPYVSIGEYFFQGEEASNLLEDAVNSSNKLNVNVEDVIIWMSQGW